MKQTGEAEDLSGGFRAEMLIDVADAQAPEFPWLSDALRKCGVGNWESKAYVRFVSSRNANAAGAEWQFETNVILEHPEVGTVVADILKGNRLGGLEFLARIKP